MGGKQTFQYAALWFLDLVRSKRTALHQMIVADAVGLTETPEVETHQSSGYQV
jgi:hypothetical protein